ncbi:hypothetical protein ALC56_08212 [Trachymyrmex septentrionalis]|uniref:Uncharacterized protein n=1 Tax=Trachymyrmex septentrionalis TaxID=34720 RepID=A0A151JVE2_9HYME|nr:hypothetical protein ALC56_08212 [Trachymyrmex septentrionalis]
MANISCTFTHPFLPLSPLTPQSVEQTTGLDSRECGRRNSILSRYFRPFERKSILKSDQLGRKGDDDDRQGRGEEGKEREEERWGWKTGGHVPAGKLSVSPAQIP